MDFRDSRLPPGAQFLPPPAPPTAVGTTASRPGTKTTGAVGTSKPGTAVGKSTSAPVNISTLGLRDESFTIEDISYILSNSDSNITASKPEVNKDNSWFHTTVFLRA